MKEKHDHENGEHRSFVQRVFGRFMRSTDSSIESSTETSHTASQATRREAVSAPSSSPRRRTVHSSTRPYDDPTARETSEFEVASPSIHGTRVPQNSARAARYFAVDGAEDVYDRNERFRDEDHFTNRSGDPRIGTHGRSYE